MSKKLTCDDIFKCGTNDICKQGRFYTIYNSLPFERNDFVFIPNQRSGIYINDDCEELDSQSAFDGHFLFVEKIPANSVRHIKFIRKGEYCSDEMFEIAEGVLRTPFHELKFNNQGDVISFYSKVSKADVFDSSKQQFLAKKMCTNQCSMHHYPKLISNEILDMGCLKTSIKFDYATSDSKVKLTKILEVFSQVNRIDYKLALDGVFESAKLSFALPINTEKSEFKQVNDKHILFSVGHTNFDILSEVEMKVDQVDTSVVIDVVLEKNTAPNFSFYLTEPNCIERARLIEQHYNPIKIKQGLYDETEFK